MCRKVNCPLAKAMLSYEYDTSAGFSPGAQELIATNKLTRIFYIFYRTRLFNRIILLFSLITILTFCTLAVLVYKFSMNSMVQKEIGTQRQVVDSASRFLDQKVDQSQDILLQLYQNQSMLNDMLFFLRHDFPLYIQFRFNNFIDSNSTKDSNLETFIKRQMERNPDILQMAVYSRSQAVVFMFNSDKTQYLHVLQKWEQPLFSALSSLSYQRVFRIQELGIGGILHLSDPGCYTTAFDLNDPDTLKTEGSLLITYKSDSINRALNMSEDQPMGYNLVLLPDGYTLFDSHHLYDGHTYPYALQLSEPTGIARVKAKSYVTSIRSLKSGILVSGIIPFSDLENRYAYFRERLVIFTGIGIALTIMLSYIATFRYAKRTQVIVKAMKQARQGNLNIRVPVSRSDELDQISLSFNRMCEELLSYINQVYVSQIKQKQAELVAFQAQINPHFLYNTLEAIRMSAMKNGATEASEMLYLLGTLFRYAVKTDTLVTLEEEVAHCRQYLQLYKVRYKDKMHYQIDIDPAFEDIRVFKLLLQPLIENAIKHGLKTSKEGNLVSIRAFADQESPSPSLVIEVEDNGKGITPHLLEQIRQTLAIEGFRQQPGSLGIRNVQERLRLMYGEPYGLEIDSEPGKGTCCRIRLPIEGRGLHV